MLYSLRTKKRMSASILDQVLSSQKQSAISEFDPDTIASKLFGSLSERERDILTKRYGLQGKKKVTLEEIGKEYTVTRERIRQIENASLNRIREQFNTSALKDLEYLIRNILEDHGDLMSEQRLVQQLLAENGSSETSSSLVRFLLNQLLSDRLVSVKESTDLYKAWATPGLVWNNYHGIIEKLVDIIKSHNEPIRLELLMDKARQRIQDEIDEERYDIILINYLEVTKKIEENKFNEWGLSHWNSIRPRRMNDKIYLVMKKEGKPLHFVEIAKKINEAQFDSRTAYPATIHNELILDPKYVLVGRGMYALTEWGFKPGIVLDVIKDVLKEAGKPMTREEIITEVLKHRMVKRSTIVLALMNKKHFSKDERGLYRLAA